jgi:hypothetical protein
MDSQDYEFILKTLRAKIELLEAENRHLRELLAGSSESIGRNGATSVEWVANSTLKNAIDKINSNKWVEAAQVIAKQYGIDFMLKESVNFSILKKAMYEYYKMPEAPDRKDKSSAANEAREKRKLIRSMVYTYIERMGDYYMKSLDR